MRMREIDLSLYFSPCPYMEAGAFYIDDTARLGRQVEKYTVTEQFPSVQGASVAIVGLAESRGGMQAGTRCDGAEKIRRELYNLYGSASWGKMVDLGDLKCGKTLQDTCFALSEVIGFWAERRILLTPPIVPTPACTAWSISLPSIPASTWPRA